MKKFMSGLAIATIASTAFVGAASAQTTDTASGGNGGVSTADSSGGAVTIGDTNNGGSVGGTIDLSGISTSDDLAAQIIAVVLAGLE
jgi:hypothetical protein